MKSRFAVSAALALLLALSGVLEAGAQSSGERRDSRARARAHIESLELFGKVYERLIRNYVDELDPESLIQTAIDAMLADLDAHSQLLREEDYDDLVVSTQGEFGGLGIQILVRDGYPTVVSPIDGTPAFRLGIRGGDQIVEIEGQSTEGWKSSEAVQALRGPKGSQVNIGIKRPGRDKIIPFSITRDIIKVESVPYAFMLDEREGIGYVRISNFARSTRDELEQRLTELEAQGMKKLVLDLRTNPGGLLQAAKDVSELFLDKGDLIVFTKGRLAQQNMNYYARGTQGRRWANRPLAVLVNGSSASASEILAGAIQDHDVGIVVGQNTFGKGSVQTVFEITPTEALKLTTAKYYTPAGRSIHRDRDHHGDPLDDEVLDLTSRSDTDLELKDREVYRTDMGREVYGGGGIMPDIEVEPSLLTDFEVALERDATYFHFVNEWLIDRAEPSMDFEVSEEMLEVFWSVAQTRGDLPEFFEDMELEMSRSLFDENSELVAGGIRREVVRRLYGNAASYRVSLERDGQVWRVVDLLRENDTSLGLFRAAEEMRKQKLAEAEKKEAAQVH